MLTLALACCVALSTVKVPVFDQPVEVSVDLQGFEADDSGKAPRAILFGSIAGGATISILAEANDPFIAGADCLDGWKGAETFDVGDVPCVESTDKLPKIDVTRTTWHAYVATADYLYDVHVSVKTNSSKFGRKEFTAIVKSFQAKGRPRAEGRPYPDAYYTLRD